jgi:hypothetical protein
MQRHRTLIIASAVAAALAAPGAFAQTSGQRGTIDDSNAYRSPTDGRSGGAGYRSETSGAVPATTPHQTRMFGRQWVIGPYDRGHIGPDNAYRSPTDGRSGGAGFPAANGVVPDTSPYALAQPGYYGPHSMYSGRSWGRASERSPTDGRSGGTGYPSPQSGAVPSTTPDSPVTSGALTPR